MRPSNRDRRMGIHSADGKVMKTLLVLPRFNRAMWGAAENQAWNLARTLNAGGRVQCEIAATRMPDEAALEMMGDIPVHRFLCAPERWHWRRRARGGEVSFDELESPALDIFLRKNRFDLFHSFATGALGGAVAKAAFETGTPLVVSCRSCDFRNQDVLRPAAGRSEATESGGELVGELFDEAVAGNARALAGAELLLCGDQRLARLLKSRLAKEHVRYFAPGVDFDYFNRPSPVDFRQFYQIPPQRPIILSVGGILQCKNQKLLLETAAILNSRGWNCQLVIVGPVLSPHYFREFEALRQERALADSVTVIPGLPPGDERFRAAYQVASLVLLPSQFDAVGSVVLEAWAAGAPVAVAPVGGGASLVEDGVNGRRAEPRHFQKWIACCEELLDERRRVEHEKMRAAGSARARELRWEARGAELAEIYLETVKSYRNGRSQRNGATS